VLITLTSHFGRYRALSSSKFDKVFNLSAQAEHCLNNFLSFFSQYMMAITTSAILRLELNGPHKRTVKQLKNMHCRWMQPDKIISEHLAD
jgi:hypothetical protein